MKVLLDPAARQASVLPDEFIERHDLAGKTVIDVPDDFVWSGKTVDWPTLTIVVDIEGARAARWAEVKAKREAVQNGGCDTPAGRVQSDPDSRGLINGAVTMAMIDPDFLLDFTLANNATVALDGPAMIAVGQAVGSFVATAHAVAVTKRAAIDAATTLAAVAEVDLEAGWPE